MLMQNVIGRSIRTGLVSLPLLVGLGAGLALAQSGSAGGSIGNDEKSLSGSRQAPRAVEREKPARKSKPEAERGKAAVGVAAAEISTAPGLPLQWVHPAAAAPSDLSFPAAVFRAN
jgi:hypothetical protein